MKAWNKADNPWTIGGRERYTLVTLVPDELLTFEDVNGFRIPILAHGNLVLAFDPWHGGVVGNKPTLDELRAFLAEGLDGSLTPSEVEAQCLREWENAKKQRCESVDLARFLNALPGYQPPSNPNRENVFTTPSEFLAHYKGVSK